MRNVYLTKLPSNGRCDHTKMDEYRAVLESTVEPGSILIVTGKGDRNMYSNISRMVNEDVEIMYTCETSISAFNVLITESTDAVCDADGIHVSSAYVDNYSTIELGDLISNRMPIIDVATIQKDLHISPMHTDITNRIIDDEDESLLEEYCNESAVGVGLISEIIFDDVDSTQYYQADDGDFSDKLNRDEYPGSTPVSTEGD